VSSSTGVLWVWDLHARRMLDEFDTLEAGSRVAASIAFSADGRYLAWFADAVTLFLYETATGRIVHRFDRANLICAFAPSGWRLAMTDGCDGSTLLYDLGLLFRSQPLPRGRVGTLASLWPLLADTDAATAHRALWRMTVLPGVEDFLAAHLPVVEKGDEKRLKGSIGDLSSQDWERRLAAEAALAALREGAADALRRAEKDRVDVEMSLRVRRLLAKLRADSPERLQDGRAVLVLEARGTPEAVALLRRLAAGIPEAHLTEQAKAALARLTR
jgi:hypothetical protein